MIGLLNRNCRGNQKSPEAMQANARCWSNVYTYDGEGYSIIPTRTTVQVVGLERPERLEINAIAVIP